MVEARVRGQWRASHGGVTLLSRLFKLESHEIRIFESTHRLLEGSGEEAEKLVERILYRWEASPGTLQAVEGISKELFLLVRPGRPPDNSKQLLPDPALSSLQSASGAFGNLPTWRVPARTSSLCCSGEPI